MLKVEGDKTFTLKGFYGFRGMAYDGFWFYLTVKNQPNIVRYDTSFKPVACFTTSRTYSYLCYDSREHCFWATVHHDSTSIYKLNDLFQEIDRRYITTRKTRGKKIMGIAYDPCSDKLFVSYYQFMVVVNKQLDEDDVFSYNYCKESMIENLERISCNLCYQISKSRRKIAIYSRTGTLIERVCIPSYYCIESIVLVQNSKGMDHINVYVLVTKDCENQFVLKFTLRQMHCCVYNNCCCKVLESIAEEEDNIACILTMEAAKLKEIITSSDDERKISAAYTSTCNQIDKAVDRELELCRKLQKILKKCGC